MVISHFQCCFNLDAITKWAVVCVQHMPVFSWCWSLHVSNSSQGVVMYLCSICVDSSTEKVPLKEKFIIYLTYFFLVCLLLGIPMLHLYWCTDWNEEICFPSFYYKSPKQLKKYSKTFCFWLSNLFWDRSDYIQSSIHFTWFYS